MRSILARSSRRHLFRHPWQLGLSLLGVALGVAVVVAVDQAGGSARRAFEMATEAVTGRATHHLVAPPTGVPEDLYRQLRVERGVRDMAPVVEGWVRTTGSEPRTLQLLGLDPFAEAPFRPWIGDPVGRRVDVGAFLTRPGTALLDAATAASLGLEPGDRLTVQVAGEERQLELLEVLETERRALTDLLLVDIATAQELLGLAGVLSRIDLLIPEGAAGAELQARIEAGLPSEVSLLRSGSRTETADELTRAFRLNLLALSLLALLCGGFLIYNTMTFAVLERRSLLGLLRAMGVTRREILGLILGEALAIGVVASVLGVGLGLVLGSGLVHLVTQTINDLYFVVRVRTTEVLPWTLAKGLLLGIGVTLAATLPPAREATTAPPRAVLMRSEVERRTRRALPRLAVLGVLAGLIGVALLGIAARSIPWSFVALFTVLVGSALLTPAATVALTRLLGGPLAALLKLNGRMAARGVVANLSRTGVAVAALMMAVAVSVGIGLMISSFRSTVDRWLSFSLPADLYVTLPDAPVRTLSEGPAAGLAPDVLEEIAGLDGVGRVNTLQRAVLQTAGGPTDLVAVDLDERSYGAFEFKSGDPAALWPAFLAGEAVIVSEPFAYRRQVATGDLLPLPAPDGVVELPIAGVFYDYASDQGIVIMDRLSYAETWRDPVVSAASVFVDAGSDPDRVAARIRQAGADRQRLVVRSQGAIREQSLEVFDRTFAITGVLRLLATAVAFMGVLSALMALQLERSRELGVLRALGLTPGQLWQLATTQTGLMGLVAGLLSLPVGIMLAGMMVHVINRRSFGWTMPLEISPLILLQALLLAVVAALLAGIYPSYTMATTSPAEALREE